MRVIKIGHIGEQETFCNHCGAEIGYFPADEKFKRKNSINYTYINCPVCHKAIIISEEEDMWKDLLD